MDNTNVKREKFLSFNDIDSENRYEVSVSEVTDLNDTVFYMLSSGTTGTPKAIELSHKNIIAALKGKKEALKIGLNETFLNWINFDHVASIIEIHLLGIFCGAKQLYILPENIISEPLRFLEIINEYRVTHTFSPNFLLNNIVKKIGRLTR